MKTMRKLFLCAVLVAGSSVAPAAVLLDEGFDNIGTLAGSGWVMTNNSTPGGSSSWFQGNTGVFTSATGDASYIGADFLSAGAGGNVDNWLITPVLSLLVNTTLTFSTRTNGAVPGDNLEVLYSLGSANTADFFSLGTIGTDFAYPTDWTSFIGSFSSAPLDVRFAFRYRVTDTSVNGDYIGLDSVRVTSVPEPGTLALISLCLLALPLAMRRRIRA